MQVKQLSDWLVDCWYGVTQAKEKICFAWQVKEAAGGPGDSHGTQRGHMKCLVLIQAQVHLPVLPSTLVCWSSAALTKVAVWSGGWWKNLNSDYCGWAERWLWADRRFAKPGQCSKRWLTCKFRRVLSLFECGVYGSGQSAPAAGDCCI